MANDAALNLNPDWLVPRWPAPPRVHALCTTRAGGRSIVPYDSLNLGQHVGDRPQDVAANRSTLQQAMGVEPVFLSQLHGNQVVRLTRQIAHGTQADGCITDQSGLACTIMVADCLPVLLCNQQGNRVAAAHAGWRGLAGMGGPGILESVVQSFATPGGAQQVQSAEMMAWLGPCIGSQSFEVGDEVRDIFVARDPTAQAMFAHRSAGKWLADLQGLARLRLHALGIERIYGNDGSADWCTVSNPSRFFSHRRDRISGRMAACIWLH